ncbi:hypothetical protein GQ457_03G034280 [Hibiscus cannabinus]
MFVLVMNTLSKLFDVDALGGLFQFHQKCKRITLTHISIISGLFNALKKNSTLLVSLQRNLKLFCRVTGFRHGHLFVHYLGVFLVTRKLTKKYCLSFIDKIYTQLRHWSSRHLNYVGRLQLIKYFLFGSLVFGVVILSFPKLCLLVLTSYILDSFGRR